MKAASVLRGDSIKFPCATVLDLWAAATRARPEHPAVHAGLTRLSYRELWSAVDGLATRILRRGLQREMPIALVAGRTAEYVAGLFAVLRAGCTAVPLDADLPPQRLKQQLEGSGAKLCLTDRLIAIPSVVETLRIDLNAAGEPAGRFPEVDPADLAYIIYTSGSSGRPKGVGISHGALANYVQGMLARIGPLEPSSMAMVSTIGADLGHTVLFGALSTGACLHLVEPEVATHPALFARYMSGHGIGVLKIVPGHLDSLLQSPHARNALPWDALILGGEALKWPLLERIQSLRPTCRIFNHYGPTEVTVAAAMGPVDTALRSAATVPIGTPLPNVSLLVLDEARQAVPVGETGELYVGGAGLARGYVGNAEGTRERFVCTSSYPSERLYRTGDRARVLPDGSVEFLGRVDDQVKIRGHRVEPGETAHHIAQCPGIRDVEVITHPSENGIPELCAYVVPAQGQKADPAQLRERLAQLLPQYMVPRFWHVLPGIPRTANGKVDRSALPAPDPAERVAYVEPHGALEQAVAEAWQQVLNIPRAGREDNFIQLGGDSLGAIRVCGLLTPLCSDPLRTRDVLRARTLRELAAKIQGREAPVRAGPAPLLKSNATRAPATPAQAGLFYIEKMGVARASYNLTRVYEMTGPLELASLQHCIQELVDRHSALRTAFEVVDGKVEQVVVPYARVPLEVFGLRALAASQRLKRAHEIGNASADEPFDLARPPLLRALLIELDRGLHQLWLTTHHIVGDAWSWGVLMEDLRALYQHSTGRSRSAPPAVELQFVDYAVSVAHEDRAAEQADLQYWTSLLKGIPTFLNLPTLAPRAPRQALEHRKLFFEIPADVAKDVERFAVSRRLTKAALCLSAFQVLLWRWSGQQSFLVGTPEAGRDIPGGEGVIGYFIQTFPVAARFSEALSAAALAEATMEQLLTAREHRHVSFEHLVEALQASHDLSHQPLTQAMFTYQNVTVDRLGDWSPLAVERRHIPRPTGTPDIFLEILPEMSPLQAAFTYSTRLFSEGVVRRLQELYLHILRSMAKEPDAAVRSIPLAPPHETKMLPRLGTAGERSFVASFVEQARERPSGAALVTAEGARSYAELLEHALSIRGTLMARKLGAGKRIGLRLENPFELVAAVLGTLAAGSSFAILHSPDASAELDAVLTSTDDPGDATASPPDALHVEPGITACFVECSGSSRNWLPLSMETLDASIRFMAEALSLRPGETSLSVSRRFAHRNVLEALVSLSCGGTFAWMPVERQEDLLSSTPGVLSDAAVVHTSPGSWSQLPNALAARLQPRVVVLNGHRALPREAKPKVLVTAGCAELGAWIRLTPLHGPDAGPSLVCPGVGAHLLDEDGREPGPCFVGELSLVEPSGKTWRTGHFYTQLENGEWKYRGTRRASAKLDDYVIDLPDIEAALRAHPDVRQAYAHLTSTAPKLVAHVIAAPGTSEEVLRQHLRDRLPQYSVPSLITCQPCFPVLPNDDIDQQALQESASAFGPHTPSAIDTVPASAEPAPDLVATIAGIWSAVLGGEARAQDNFFRLGGSSLLAIEVVGRIYEALDVEIPLTAIVDYPVLSDFVAYLESLIVRPPAAPANGTAFVAGTI